VAFLRIVRDKRGYEYFSLVQETAAGRGKVRQRLLYWYRTPPNIKVGRPPFDQETMRALEAQNPDVQFDWDALHDTPPPLPSEEPWRERRRAERAARQLRDADEGTETASPDPDPAAPGAPIDALERTENQPPVDVSILIVETVQAVVFSASAAAGAAPAAPGTAPASGSRRRHRRRRRGGRAGAPVPASGSPALPTDSPAISSTERDHSELQDDEE